MNEFYTPDRSSVKKTETIFDEPAEDIKIVVDNNDSGTVFCRKCGCRMEPSDVFCSRCGARVGGETQTQTAHSASVHGAAQQTQTGQAAPQVQNVYNYYNYGTTAGRMTEAPAGTKNKWISVFLCLIFGVFGAHRFYEGKILSGLLYLFTAGLCGIGWLIDLIILLGKPTYYNP